MTADDPRLGAVHAWLLRLVRAQAHGYGWADLREGFLERATEVLRQPKTLSDFSDKNQEKLVWNIAFGIAESFRGRADTVEAKVAFVDACPEFFASHFSGVESYSQSCEMFWDIVIGDGWHSDDVVRDHILEALRAQLAIPNLFVQWSALHGFNHLQDPKCRPLIDEFLKTCEDEHLREYAKVARTFQAM
jgi:hypothetical protein